MGYLSNTFDCCCLLGVRGQTCSCAKLVAVCTMRKIANDGDGYVKR